mgnify:FL=1
MGVSVADCEFDREGPAPGEAVLSGVVEPPSFSSRRRRIYDKQVSEVILLRSELPDLIHSLLIRSIRSIRRSRLRGPIVIHLYSVLS